MTTAITSYVQGRWHEGTGSTRALHNATTEETMATCSSEGIDFGAILDHGRTVGSPALRAMSFVERGAMLKALAGAIHEHREELIALSIANAGTTRSDAKFDIDGATATMAAYAHFAKQAGDRGFLSDGEGIQLGRTARFWGQHVWVPRRGVAVHINAFNFPAWNMMEKAACALTAGMPVIEKPGTPTALLSWRISQIVIESGLVPEGGYQFLCGSTGDLLDRMGPQDALAFTGSSGTGNLLRSNANLLKHNVRVNIEADSLNAAVLGPGLAENDEAYRLFIRNVVLDIRQKTGQKCTAVRRVMVPSDQINDVRDAITAELQGIVTGDPADADTKMGPLASAAQLRDVRAGIGKLAAHADCAIGGADSIRDKGYFVAPTLFVAKDAGADIFHDEEVFGPVATVMPYDGTADQAAQIVNRGGGGLVTSLYCDDGPWVEAAVAEMAPWHGRLWIGSEKMAAQSVPPGTVLPAMIHGGPGRAGGGEELGGLRGVTFYMQRTALQGFKGQLATPFGPIA